MSLTVIKLGGALLTDKQRPYTLRQSILNQAAAEVKACLDAGLIDQLLLVHGVGSFGHPPVLEHDLHKGFKAPEQRLYLTYTQNKVHHLRLAIAEAFHTAGVAVSIILPSSCMAAANTNLKTSFLDAVAGFIDVGMVPLLGGDVLVDDQMGFCVYGGDKIAVDLAQHFAAIRLIFATEVAGIFDQNPQKHPEAQLINSFRLDAVADFGTQSIVDASGAMAGKLTAVLPLRNAIAAGLQVHVLSMMEKGNLIGLLKGSRVGGTQIVL